jgi:hypothetical protein
MSDEAKTPEAALTPAPEVKKFSKKKLKEILIEIDGESWFVRELTGKERDAFMNRQAKRVPLNSRGEIAGPGDANDHQGDLLCLSLVGPTGNRPSIAELRDWPASDLAELYQMALVLSGLTKEAKEDVKKN